LHHVVREGVQGKEARAVLSLNFIIETAKVIFFYILLYKFISQKEVEL